MTQPRILQASRELMAAVLAETMERMAFLFPVPFDPAPLPPAEAVLVRIDFGLAAGEALELAAGEGLGRLLAGKILAEPVLPADSATARDALRELVNVTCGSLLGRIGASAEEMRGMTIPTVSSFDGPGRWAGLLARPGAALLDVEGHAVAARLGRAA